MGRFFCREDSGLTLSPEAFSGTPLLVDQRRYCALQFVTKLGFQPLRGIQQRGIVEWHAGQLIQLHRPEVVSGMQHRAQCVRHAAHTGQCDAAQTQPGGIGQLVKEGDNEITVKVVGSLKNTFGHFFRGEGSWISGPGDWNLAPEEIPSMDQFYLMDYGLNEPFELLQY